jgi:hypothetical protein
MLEQVSLVAITFMQEYFADVAEISFSMNRVPAFIASYPKIMLQNHAITIKEILLDFLNIRNSAGFFYNKFMPDYLFKGSVS